MKHQPNLLIVDDSEENLVLLESILGKTKANLIQALSGYEALEKIRGIDLAVAIIDVRMPGMSGYELAVKINEERQDEEVPIIFLTASHVNEAQVVEGYQFGAVDYIVKPVNNHILLNKIQVFIDLSLQKLTIIKDAALLKKSANELIRVNAALKKSEAKYRSYIHNAPDGVFIIDETGRFIEVNEAAIVLTGYSKEKLLTMSITDILSQQSLKDGLAHFRKVVKTGASKADMMFRNKNGTTRWWTVDAVRLSETRFLGFAKDITEEKVMEESLLKSEKEYRLLIDTTHESVIVAQDGLIKFLNHMTVSLLEGYSEQDLIDSPFPQYIHPDDRAMVVDNHMRRIATEVVHPRYAFRMVTRDGVVKWVEINAALIVWQGKPATLNFLSDITKRRQSEDALQKSEELFRSVVYNSIELTIITDANGIVNFVSPQCENVVGYPNDKFMGKQMPDIIYPDDAEKCQAVWEQVYQKDLDLREFEYRILDDQGAIRWVSHSAKLVRVNDIVLGIQNTIRNITERKVAEQAMKVSEEKYKTMLNASPDGILLIDMKGIITEASEIGLELFGADNRDDLVGKDFFRFVPSDEKNTITEIIEKTMNEGLAQNIGLKIRKKNQSLFAAEISVTLIQDPNGEPLSYMIIIRDISHRQKMEAKQIHADRMANLGEMASGIAHEINQPLNIISMVMDKMLFETSRTETIDIKFLKSKSDKIFENITRMRNIIDHIRAFSRSHDDYVPTAFDINSSIRNAVSMISEQFKHIGINLNLQLSKQIPQIFGNTYKFEQVIVNLLVNAKDTVLEKKNKLPEFSEMNIGINSYKEDHSIIVEVTDNGFGINNDDINNIMLPFYTTKDEGQGTGLGLSICYQIIKEMDGTIDITSERPNGTKIRLALDIQTKK